MEIYGKKIMSYIVGWGDWTADDVKGDKLTHIYISFARISNDFKISDIEHRMSVEGRADLPLPDLAASTLISDNTWREIEKLQQRYPRLKIIIAIGGWAAEGFSDMAASPITRQIFIDSVAQYVEQHKLDGVDIDWEYPVSGANGVIKSRQADKENMTELIKLMRETFGDDKEISFCAGANSSFVQTLDFAALSPLVDSVNLMAYDMKGVWHEITDHHTNLYSNGENPYAAQESSSAEAVDRLINAGVPPSKLVLGMATYGREFNGVTPGPNKDGLFQKFDKKNPTIWRSGSISFSALEKYYIEKNGFKRFWDSASHAPYLYNEKEGVFISYDDKVSIADKVTYAKYKGLGGVMYWEYTSDIEGKLLDIMHSTMHN